MPRTLDGSADHRAFIERRAVVRANCAQTMNFAFQLREQYRLLVDYQSFELTLSEIACCRSWPEVIRAATIRVAVDHDSHMKDHDPSQIAAAHYQQVSCQSNSECSPARLPVLAPAD